MRTTRVCLTDEYDEFIGRPSKVGNPFIIGKDGTRIEVIQKFKDWIITQPELLEYVYSLEGKRIACYCQLNKSCHGDVIINLIDDHNF